MHDLGSKLARDGRIWAFHRIGAEKICSHLWLFDYRRSRSLSQLNFKVYMRKKMYARSERTLPTKKFFVIILQFLFREFSLVGIYYLDISSFCRWLRHFWMHFFHEQKLLLRKDVQIKFENEERWTYINFFSPVWVFLCEINQSFQNRIHIWKSIKLVSLFKLSMGTYVYLLEWLVSLIFYLFVPDQRRVVCENHVCCTHPYICLINLIKLYIIKRLR